MIYQDVLHSIEKIKNVLLFFKTYDVGHKGKATGVIYSPGAIFTSSTDNTIKVLEPNLSPAAITTINDHSAPVTRVNRSNIYM